MTVRRGAPDSVKAVGLNVYFEAGAVFCERTSDGDAARGVDVAESVGLGGRGGAGAVARDSFAGGVGGGPDVPDQ